MKRSYTKQAAGSSVNLRDAGPDIPDDLLAAQESGNVMFLCGAGASKNAGLPLFDELVLQVYEALDESLVGPAEGEAMEQEQYDRVLRCLERRLVDPNPMRGQEMRNRIRSVVANALTPPDDPDLSNHLAVLKLSRGPEGSIRLVTTNFDTLFERAWITRHREPLASHAGPAMPQPRTAGFEGVLHLHGRIADPAIQPPLSQTDLVLTSVEFGDAYLRSGWASRYLYDLVRAYTVVLVGYAANDPPLRYILEVLEADRQRFRDLNTVYAFADTAGQPEELIGDRWRAKGIEPILYRSDGNDHSTLYDTIQEWQVYARNPTGWLCHRLTPTLSEPPPETQDEGANQVKRMLARADSGAVVATVNANPKWLLPLVKAGIFDRQPTQWIAKRIDDPAMIRACIDLDSIDDDTQSAINRALATTDSAFPNARHRAWRLLLRAKQRQIYECRHKWEWEERQLLAASSPPDTATCQLVAALLRPRVAVTPPMPWHLLGDSRHDQGERLLDHLSIAFESVINFPPLWILKQWPDSPSTNLALLRALDRMFADALDEIMHDVGDLDYMSSGTVPSIEQLSGHEFGWRSGFRPIAKVLSELALRIGTSDSVRATGIVADWAKSGSELGCRLALFASSHDWMPADEAARIVNGLSERVFWADGAEPELILLLLKRWSAFGSSDREAIEMRLRQGPPRELYVEETVADDGVWQAFRESTVYKRLSHLQAIGANLGPAATATIDRLAEGNPNWTPGIRERSDDWGRMASYSGLLQGDPGLMEDVPDHELVDEAKRIERVQPGEHTDVWRVFCRSDPWRAFKGISDKGKQGEWDTVAVRGFFWEVADVDDVAFQRKCAHFLIGLPVNTLRELSGTVASWLSGQLSVLQGDGSGLFLEAWDRLASVVYMGPPNNTTEIGLDRHLLSKALGDPGGQLADVLIRYVAQRHSLHPDAFASAFMSRAEQVLRSPTQSGLFGRMIAVQHIAYLYNVNSRWATEKLLPLLDWEGEEADALWWSYATYGQIGPPGLFNILKCGLLQGATKPEITGVALDNLVGKAIQVYYWVTRDRDSEYQLLASEVKDFLRDVPSKGRIHAAWLLWRILWGDDDDNPAERVARWDTVVGPIFRTIWPKDLRCRSREVSRRLVYMALKCNDALPDVVEAIVDVLVPYTVSSLCRWLETSESDDRRPQEHVAPIVRMANAVLVAEALPGDLGVFLQECVTIDPEIESDSNYIRLFSIRRASERLRRG